MPIHFGTDGWRAVISDTFTFHNLRLVSQAIADAIRSDAWNDGVQNGEALDINKMVVGFDTRFLSDRFAAEVARVLAGNGYTVYLSQGDAPTPAISYMVRPMNAIAGGGVLKSILKGTGCEVREIRGEMNPGFGGVHPEPIARYLGALAGAIGTGMGDIGLAADG